MHLIEWWSCYLRRFPFRRLLSLHEAPRAHRPPQSGDPPAKHISSISSLQEWLGLISAQCGSLEISSLSLTFLDQLDLMDISDLLELSKGISKIGAKIFESLWFKLRTSKSPFSFLDKHGFGA